MQRLAVAVFPLLAALAFRAPPVQEGSPLPPSSANVRSIAEQQDLARRIDAALAASWEEQELRAAAPADDPVWLRRLSLDLRGEIPSAEEVAAFLGDPAPDKRTRKIDEFLSDRRFSRQLSGRWSRLLLSAGGKNFKRMMPYLQPWLEEEFAQGTGLPKIVEGIVGGTAASTEPGGCAVMCAYHDSIETLTAITARAFLGLQIQCAQCHDHPFDHWKRTDFNRLAGFFTEVRAEFAQPDLMAILVGPSASPELEEEAAEVMGGKKRGKEDAAEEAAEGMGGEKRRKEDAEGKKSRGFRIYDMSLERDLEDRLKHLRVVAKHGSRRAEMGEDGEGSEMMSKTEMSKVETGAGNGERGDHKALIEMHGVLRQAATKHEEPLALLARQPGKLESILARLLPDARALVDKYLEKKELFDVPGFPDGTDYQPVDGVTRRRALADWVVDPGNPWFGRAMANRIWQQLMGKGLIEPVDDLSGSTDQVLPEVLAELGRELVAHGGDVRFLYGAIARTRAYALGNSTNADAEAAHREERWFAAHPVRILTLDQIASSLARVIELDVAGKPRTDDGTDHESDAVRPETLARTLALSCGAPDDVGETWWAATIPQSLAVMNGGLTDGSGAIPTDRRARDFLDTTRAPVERLTRTWLSALGRPPAEAEAGAFVASALEHPGDPMAAFADAFWALLNTCEFQTNH